MQQYPGGRALAHIGGVVQRFQGRDKVSLCIKVHTRLFGVDVKKICGSINRELCISNGIHTANAVELLGRIAALQPAAG